MRLSFPFRADALEAVGPFFSDDFGRDLACERS
jgi:hypothetical protein